MATTSTTSHKVNVTCQSCGHKGNVNIPCSLSRRDEIKHDMEFGQPSMITTTPDQDMKSNIDCFMLGIPVASRRRRFPLSKYGEISIRNNRENGAKTERQKILDGECKAKLFIWEFTDCWVIIGYETILAALKNDIGYAKCNNDKETSAYYINALKIEHLLIPKGLI